MAAHGEQGRLECVFVVTALAILAGELAFVWIGRVAIRALPVCDWPFEVATLVAIVAAGLDVRSVQREGGLIVIETRGGPDGFPT